MVADLGNGLRMLVRKVESEMIWWICLSVALLMSTLWYANLAYKAKREALRYRMYADLWRSGAYEVRAIALSLIAKHEPELAAQLAAHFIDEMLERVKHENDSRG